MRLKQTLLAGVASILFLNSFATLAIAESRYVIEEEAYETARLPTSDFTLRHDSMAQVSIPNGWRNVKKVFVAAEAYGRDATVEVIANGEVKGTLYIPRTDPYYTVTIGETVKSLEFKHVSGGQVRILEVKAVMSARSLEVIELPPGFEGIHLSSGVASRLAQRIIDRVNSIEADVDVKNDYVPYLLPIKLLAGRAKATADVKGDLSTDTRAALAAVMKQIEFADPLIEALLRTENLFDRATDLLSLKEEIEERLD